jgi:hypothetical protein
MGSPAGRRDYEKHENYEKKFFLLSPLSRFRDKSRPLLVM